MQFTILNLIECTTIIGFIVGSCYGLHLAIDEQTYNYKSKDQNILMFVFDTNIKLMIYFIFMGSISAFIGMCNPITCVLYMYYRLRL